MAAALLLGGCLTPPVSDTPPVLNTAVAGELARGNLGEWPAADWWKHFNDPQLDALIGRALAQSPTMAVARARQEQARVAAGAVAASAGVRLDASASVTRQRFSDNYLYPPPYAGHFDNSGQTDLNFSYDFDFWGRNASALKAALGEQEAAKAEAYAAAANLSAAVAKTYFQWQAINAHLALVESVETRRTELIALQAQLVDAGVAAGDNLHPLVADQAAPGLTKVQLSTQADQTRHALQALVGDRDVPMLVVRPLPEAGGGVPADAHIDLLARRADVAAARDQVDASLKNVEAARAAFYPDISIGAFLGLSSLSMSRLLTAQSRELGVSPAIHLPLFDAGRLRANLDSQRADVTLAVAEYNQAVLTAVADVNDAAVRLNGTRQERDAIARQRAAHQRIEATAAQRQTAGLGTRRTVVGEQLAILMLDDQEIARRAAALDAQVDLIKALGGGFDSLPQSQTN